MLDVQNITGNAMLAVSSLASGYCNLRPDCGRDSEVSHLIKKLIDLTHDCNIQNGDAKRIHFALRALGNIGHSQEQVSHLSRCFTNQDAPADIRIAAIDAFRRIPCDAKVRRMSRFLFSFHVFLTWEHKRLIRIECQL